MARAIPVRAVRRAKAPGDSGKEAPLSRVLVVTADVLRAQMAGPALRAWHIAERLAAEHEVRLLTTSAYCEVPAATFTAVAAGPEGVAEAETWSEIMVLQGYVTLHHPVLANSQKIIVFDIYDPLHLETLALTKGASGPARDWHVLRESLKLDGEPDRDFDAFLNEVESRRARAIADARAAVGSHLARQFVQSLRQAISRRSWRASADSVREPGSARRFAVATLERLRQRATKRSANLVKQAPERRHRARIAFKKARYAGEFFKRLFEKDSRVYLRGVAKIQDVLGADNDLKTADALLLEIETAGPTPAARIEARRRREELTRAGHKNVRRLKRVEERMDALKPFWR